MLGFQEDAISALQKKGNLSSITNVLSSIDGIVLERKATAGLEARRHDRVDRRQIGARDFVATFDQHIGQVFLRRGIAVLARVHGGSDHFIREGRNAPGGPERVIVSEFQVSRRRRLRPPRPRIESIAFELADRRVLHVRNGLPRAQCESEGEQSAQRRVL